MTDLIKAFAIIIIGISIIITVYFMGLLADNSNKRHKKEYYDGYYQNEIPDTVRIEDYYY